MKEEFEKNKREMYRYLLARAMEETKLVQIAKDKNINRSALSEFRRKGYLGGPYLDALGEWLSENGYLEKDRDPGREYGAMLHTVFECWCWLRMKVKGDLEIIALEINVSFEKIQSWDRGHFISLEADEFIAVWKQCLEWAEPRNGYIDWSTEVDNFCIYSTLLNIQNVRDKNKQFTVMRGASSPREVVEQAVAMEEYHSKKRDGRIELTKEEFRILQMYQALDDEHKAKFERALRDEFLDSTIRPYPDEVEVYVPSKEVSAEADSEDQ